MLQAIQAQPPSQSGLSGESPNSNVNGSRPHAWSRVALGLGLALLAVGKANPGTATCVAAMPSTAQARPYPDNIAEFLLNGTFGAPFADGVRLDGVKVARGDQLSNAIKDPYNEGGGIILCDRAKAIFNQHRHQPMFASPEGQFVLAVGVATFVRFEFMSLPVLGGDGQNFIAAVHTHNSKLLPGGSPLLSLTLNNFTAAYFGLGGVDNEHNPTPVNQDGKVFLSRVNNASTIYPVVARKIKGVELNNNPDPTTDRGMNLAPGVNIPFAEMLIVGAYYFHDTLSVQDAFRQSAKNLRKIPDLYGSSVSFQMLEPIQGEPLFLPFQHHLPRILESLKKG